MGRLVERFDVGRAQHRGASARARLSRGRRQRASVYTAAVAVLFVVAAVQVAVVAGAGAGPIAPAHPFAEGSACELLPIGTSYATIAAAAVGDEVTDILNSDLPGQRGWLTWTGDVSEPVLAASLVLPGDSQTYVDPDDPGDRAVSVGDWVRAKPGVVNGRAVRRALDRLKNREIVVAVWDAARAQGTNAAYHVSGFARFSVTGHGLPAENRISARYLGPAACLPPPGGLDALDATASTAEDEPVSIELTGRSPSSATLTFILTSPQQGSVAIEGPASCTSVPATSPNHTDDDDDDGGSRPGRRDDDDDDGGGGGQGGPATCSITALYTPDPDANGVDGFTFTVSDDRTTSAPASVTIDISPVNDPPVTAPDSAETRQGTAVDIPAAEVLSNDQPGPANEAAQKLTVTAVRTDGASHGTATLAGETITYTPDAGYSGPATITYTACDNGTTGGQADPRCSDGTITITVTVGANQPPSAIEQQVATAEDTSLGITLTGDDPDGDPLTFTVTEAPAHGALSGTLPNLTYTPGPDANGTDAFTFTVSDGQATSAPAAVTIEVSEVNDPPVTEADSAAGRQDEALELAVADVLSNDRPGPPNEADQTLTVTGVESDAASHGTATLAGGKITYTPDAGYSGPATITYTACDNGTTGGQADPRCSDGTITITVGANEPPAATEQRVTTAEDTSLGITLTGEDPDGDALTFAVTGQPAKGVLSGTAPNLTYTPDPDANGADSFTFTASDGQDTSPPATVAIIVTEVNDAPAAGADDFAVGVTETTAIPGAVVVANDIAGPDNEAGQNLDVTGVSTKADSHGTVNLVGDEIRYTPDPGFAGRATIGYTLCDKGTTAGQPDPLCDSEGSIALVVVPPNRPPTADPQELTTSEDVPLPLELTGDDPDGHPLMFLIVDPPEHGTLEGDAPSFTYVPDAHYNGPDEFTFIASDGQLDSETATVAIDVTEVNDPPVLGPDSFTLGGAGTLPPLPPLPTCGDPCGVIWGDPHVYVFDHEALYGHYQFQTHGEFIAAKSTTDDFEVQVRNVPVEGSREVSIVVGVAMRVAGHRVSMYRTLTGADTFIDGVRTNVPALPMALPGGGTIGTYGSDNETFVVWPDGSVAVIGVRGLWREFYRFTVEVGVAPARLTHMVGLLGNADGQKGNDLVIRDGEQIDFPDFPLEPDFDALYHSFGHSWRISQAESLFDYGPGETTETFTDRTFPDRPVTRADLSPDDLATATAQCGVFGVTEPEVLDSCIIDVGVTGDVEFAASAAEAQETAFAIPNNTGVTSLGDETTVTIDAADENAVRAFTATAGQKVTLSVSGNTIPLADLTVRRPDGSAVASLTVSEDSDFHDTFTLPVEGTYTITIDPRQDHTGELTFSLDHVPENTGVTSIGVPTTVMIGTIGENAVRSFTAEAGQMVTLSVAGNTIELVDLVVRQPDGSAVASLTVSEDSDFHDTFTLPVAGTYTITVDPRRQNTGMLTFSLDSVPPNTGTIPIGTATEVTIGTVGENAVRTFVAEAGQRVTLTVSGNTIELVDLAIRQPNGSFVGGLTVSGATGFSDVMTLPVAGTYTLTIDPRAKHVGALTVLLTDVPPDDGSILPGVPTMVTIATPGENAVRTFTATAGQLVTLTVSANTIEIVDLTIRQPNGAFVGGTTVSGESGFRDVMTLPVAGTYTLEIDPRLQHVGSLTVLLEEVPPNTGTIEIGTAQTVTTSTRGENAVRTFTGTAGQLLTLTVTGNTIELVDLEIRQPNGNFVGGTTVSGETGFRDVMTLPVDGTYTLEIDPRQQHTGSVTVLLTNVPTNTGTITVGTAQTVTIGTPGENAVRTFPATAGQMISLTVSGNTIDVADLEIRQPNGNFVDGLTVSGESAFHDVITLPVDGTYTLEIDPRQQHIGALTVLVANVPTNAGPITVGTAQTVTIGTPGENAVRTFTATAGQLLTLSVSGNNIPGIELTVVDPDGSLVEELFVFGATGFSDVMTMPVTGTYTLMVDPSGPSVGSLSLLVDEVDDTGELSFGVPNVVTIETPGENAIRTFAATAGQRVALAVSGNTIPDAQLVVTDPNGDFVDTLFVFGSTAFSEVMTLPVDGTYTITVDPFDDGTGTLTLAAHAVPENSGETSLDEPTTVSIGTPGETAVRTFTGTADQRVAISVSGNTIDGAQLVVRDPDDSFVGGMFVFNPTGFGEVMTLPVDGTYTITVDPLDGNTGALTFTLIAVPENTGETSLGTATPVSIGTPGETAARTFTASAGERVAVSVSDNTIDGAELVVTDPNGDFVGDLFVFESSEFGDAMTLPVDGTYTITVDPFAEKTGSLTFTLHAVPENTGDAVIGEATTVSIGTPGEEAVRSFDGVAGQLVSLSVEANTIPEAVVTVREPDGSFVDSLFVSEPTAFGDVMTLAVDGTYTITVDPRADGTGSLTFTLGAVPTNTGEISIGVPTEVTIGTPGENAARTFAATAGQQVTLSVSENTIPGVELIVSEPDGSFVDGLFVFEPTATSEVMTLPVDGTYTLTIDPVGESTGALTVALDEVVGGAGLQSLSVAATGRSVLAATSGGGVAAAASDPPVLTLSVADVLANDRPGPPNESHQSLTVTGVSAASNGTATLDGDVIRYTPDYLAPTTLTYTACDDGTTNGEADPRCSDGTIAVTVTANNPPTAAAQTLATQEDAPLAITLSGADADGDELAFRITDAPAHGTLSGVAPALTYTPAPNFHGTDSFLFATNDTRDESPPARISISVSEVNDVPSAQPDSIAGGVGKTVSVAARTLLANDSAGPFDERTQTLSLAAVTATPDTRGTVSLAEGAVTYEPDAGFNGTAKVLYTACDNGTTNGAADPRCAEGELSIVPNLAPTATAQSVSTLRNTPVTITLAGTDPENDILSFAVASGPAHGTLTGTGDTRVYTPDASFAGSDSFTFTARDAYTTSAPATVSIGIAATPLPVVKADAVATPMNTAVLVDVMANDTAAAGSLDPATLAVVLAPTNGTAVVEAGKIRYTPAAGVAPDDRFTYQVCDTFGVCGRAEVTVSTVVPNRPPVGQADDYQIDTGATLDVVPPGLLENDSDPDPGDAIQARLDTGVSAGNLLLRFDGSFRYTPGPGFAGLDSFTYFVQDRDGLRSSPVKVTIDVVPLGPLAVDDAYTTTKHNPLTVMPSGVLANDRDAHTTDVLTVSLDRAPFRGTVDLNPDGSFVYTPDPDFVGTDSFLYVATDVRGVPSTPARVEIKVLAPPAPVPTVSGTTPGDGTEVCAPAPVTANVAAPDGESIERWTVTARNLDRGTPVVLGSGTGPPPSPLATFDPTKLINGVYQILIAAESSGGGKTTAVTNVIVCGDMKLGDYQTTYLDMETSIAGFPIQVMRTYDTTDKRRGDFGIGWRVELSGLRATPNNRLGQGGWYTEPFGFPFTRFRFKTTIPHFVTVTSPGGRVEVFDLVPAPSGPLLSLTTPEFHARPGTGTTSTLEDVDSPILALGGDSLATNGLFGGTIYDPRLFRLTTADGLVLIIDRFRGLQSMKDRNGNEVTISADGVHSATTPRHLTFVRDGAGRITEIRGPEGKTTQYAYSAAGDLQRFVAANGGVDAFSYDANHRLLAVDGPGGVRLRTLNYGPDGRVTSLTDATGNTITLSSDVDDRTDTVTSPSGRLTMLSTYGADGNLASLEEVFSGHSRITRYEYDGEGRRTKKISPLGREQTWTYDAAGNVTSHRSPKGETWHFAYNAMNLPTTTTAPGGTVVDSRTYDDRGNLTSASFSSGRSVAFTNDSKGRPEAMTDSFGTTRYVYDDDHQVTSEIDGLGRITKNTYDASGRLSSKENPAGERTEFVWNALDKVVEMTLPNGAKRTSSYDAFGRLITHTDTAGRTSRYRYDDAGRLVAFVDRASETTTYSYDKDGNLVEVAYPDGDLARSVRDPAGRLASVSDSDTIVEYTYNDANDLMSERTRGANGVALPDVTLSYTTDPNGQRTSVDGPGGTVHYEYDNRLRLKSVRDPAGQTFSLAYDGSDRMTGFARPNDVDDVLTFKEDSLTARNAVLGSDVVSRAEYGLDALGRRTSLTDLDGSHTFTHDLGNRLTGAVHPSASGLAAESYAYDKVGNRTAWVGSPADTVSYDSGMQLLSDGTYDYTYDAEGRVTERRNRATGAVTRYRWNSAGQLTSIEAPGGATSTYRYDAFGRRLEANDNGVVRRFVYSGWNLHNEFDGTNALRATYVTGDELDDAFEVVRDGTRYYPLFDGIGSVTALTNDAGAVVGRTRYSAFGAPQPSGVTDRGFTYTGHQFDSATGLVYARARYYDPTTGRFLSQDPEPAMNPYTYAYNAPFDFTDPTGRGALVEYLKAKLPVRVQLWIWGTTKAIEEAKRRNLDRVAAKELERLQATMVQVVDATRVYINDQWKP